MWAYKSYNPNAPDPEEPSDAREPQAPPSAPRHFSFRSLFGRYREPQERARLAQKFVGLVDSHPPNKHVIEDEPSDKGRDRRVSFSSQASGKSGRSRRSRSSSRVSSLFDGGSTSRSEVMLAEIMELLTEMKDDIRKANRKSSDEEISDTSSGSTTDFGSETKKPSHDSPLRVSSSYPGSQSQATSTAVETVSAAAKKAVRAGTKENAKNKLDHLGRKGDNGPAKKASIMAAVGNLAETLGQDVTPADIVGELPSLEHLGTEGLQEILNAYRSETKKEQPSQGVSNESTPAAKPSPHSKPGRSDGQVGSDGKKTDRPVDKHDWDKQRPLQAFDWPTQDEIDRDNALGDASDRPKPGRVGSEVDINAATRQDDSGLHSRGASLDRHTDRTLVQLPSPGASTIASDFGAPVDSNGSDPAFNIVFPSTPLHQPGDIIPSSFVTKALSQGTKTADPTCENVMKSEQSGQGSPLANPVPNTIAAQDAQVAVLFHQRTSALMQGCLGKYIAAEIDRRSTLTVQ
jgi:hypothetical protein